MPLPLTLPEKPPMWLHKTGSTVQRHILNQTVTIWKLRASKEFNIVSTSCTCNIDQFSLINRQFITQDFPANLLGKILYVTSSGKTWFMEGQKRTGSNQKPHILRGVWSEPGLFVTSKHLQKTFFSLSAQFRKQSLNIWKRLTLENTVYF